MKHYLIFLCVFLSACSINQDAYRQQKPAFAFVEFFNGPICAWGLVKDGSGQVSRKFSADISAKSSENKVELDEKFLFNDGEVQTRVWQFEKRGEKWFGTAGDVIGEAEGEIFGDSLKLSYTLNVKSDDSEWEISMGDWLHRIDKNTVMGQTEMSKFGLDVGSIQIVMTKKKDNISSCIQE